MSRPGLGVVTIAHGRHDHLLLQEKSLACGPRPDVRVVVAMADQDVAVLVPSADVVELSGRRDRLPLAAARNAGAERALSLGAERLLFLDVDCVAGANTLAGYAAPPLEHLTVWCGPVTYLGALDRPYDLGRLADLDAPHPARPDPGPGQRRRDDQWELFWSLAFAVDRSTWREVGGFDEAYVGYGAEDTDFGQRVSRAGGSLVWSGDARAYHQWHPSASPPVQHCEDIVRNANLFHQRWGWWPMSGWLEQLRELGLVAQVGGAWTVCE